MSTKILAILTGPTSCEASFYILTYRVDGYGGGAWGNGEVIVTSEICDYSPYDKQVRQVELEYWRYKYPEAHYVLCNPDGSGVEDL